MRRPVWVALLAVACSTPARGEPRPIPEPDAKIGRAGTAGTIATAFVVSSVDGAPADRKPKRARHDQRVILYAAIQVVDGKTRALYSDAPGLGGHPLADAPIATLRWNKIEPVDKTMSNTDSGSFRFEPIAYRATPMRGTAGRGSIPADVHPTITPDHGRGVGTMRFQIVVAQDGRTIASPGVEARRGRGSGGLTDDVHRVTLRRDDTYLGFLTELYGQPYIWASAGGTPATHQSERLEGSDCADFVVYGMRRMGRPLAYTWTGDLPRYTRLLAAGKRATDGVFRDRAGRPLPFTRVGDLILFPRHVGVLTQDRAPLGVLDDGDVIMHSLFDTPKEVPIAESEYAHLPAELRRWK